MVGAIRDVYPELSEHDVRSTSMGSSGVDVLLSTAALERFPYSVECKNHAKMAVYSLYAQATANVIEGTKPLLVIKQNRSDPLVVLSLKDFMDVCKQSR